MDLERIKREVAPPPKNRQEEDEQVNAFLKSGKTIQVLPDSKTAISIQKSIKISAAKKKIVLL
jgi:hypothetical protein